MGKIAFVFSGQGDQFPGMGKELFEKETAAAKIYEMCDGIRPGTSEQCFSGSEEELKNTANTQPCLFATELAQAQVLKERGVFPDAVAGFSLGEVVAATAAGLFSPETGFGLVCRRGELMARSAEKYDTAMAAVVKLSEDEVNAVCDSFPNIYPVNFNCPGNITVSGLASDMPAFFEAVKAAGGRAIPLKVKGAFHSPYMAEASEEFAKELEKVAVAEPAVPLYSNLTAEPYSGSAARLLSKQICSPVRWERLIRNMIENGIDTFIEIGPGRTLINMIKKTDPGVTAVTAAEYLGE